MIKQEGSKWVLYSADGKKRLGSFPTQADAVAREKQVLMFKNMNDQIRKKAGRY